MSHRAEHEAIIETLTRIERQTGWATAWRVDDLKEFWGDEDESENDDDTAISVESAPERLRHGHHQGRPSITSIS